MTVCGRTEIRQAIAVVTTLFLIDSGASTAAADFPAAINAKRTHLMALVQSRAVQTTLETGLAAALAQEVPSDLPCAQKRELLGAVTDLGLSPSGRDAGTGFIVDDSVTGLLVATLSDPCGDVRAEAFQYLERFAKTSQLVPRTAAIKAALAQGQFGDAPAILALLPLSADERAQLLATPRLPTAVRAGLGDQGAEAELVRSFNEAKTFQDKADGAERLGYAATRLCGATLVGALRSDLVRGSAEGQVSVRYAVIVALGRMHQDEPLLTSEIRRIGRIGDDAYGGEDAVRQYLAAVFAWAQATYGFVPPGSDPPAILYKQIPIGRPLEK